MAGQFSIFVYLLAFNDAVQVLAGEAVDDLAASLLPTPGATPRSPTQHKYTNRVPTNTHHFGGTSELQRTMSPRAPAHLGPPSALTCRALPLPLSV